MWNTTQHFSRKSDISLPSHISHLLTSNDPPGPHEMIEVQHYIQETERQLASLSDQVNPSQHPEIASLEAHAVALRSTLSAIRRLPPELTQEIILWGVAERGNRITLAKGFLLPKYQKEETEWPWTLAHISSRWREVALSIPQLWTFLPTLTVIPRPAWVKRREMARYRFMIEHTMGHPVHIRLSLMQNDYRGGFVDEDEPAVVLLYSYSKVEDFCVDNLAVTRYSRFGEGVKHSTNFVRNAAEFLALFGVAALFLIILVVVVPLLNHRFPNVLSRIRRVLG